MSCQTDRYLLELERAGWQPMVYASAEVTGGWAADGIDPVARCLYMNAGPTPEEAVRRLLQRLHDSRRESAGAKT